MSGPKSTISRELSRNRLSSGRYSPLHAAGAYQLRRRREALIEKDRALRSFVLDRLAEGWSCNFFGPCDGSFIAEFVISAHNLSVVRQEFPQIFLRIRGIPRESKLSRWIRIAWSFPKSY